MVEEELGHFATRGDQVDRQWRKQRRVPEDPEHPIRVGLAPRDIQGWRRGVDGRHPESSLGEKAGSCAGTTADVAHSPGTQLGGQLNVRGEVAAVIVQLVIELAELRIPERGVGHGVSPAQR